MVLSSIFCYKPFLNVFVHVSVVYFLILSLQIYVLINLIDDSMDKKQLGENI